MAQIARTGDEPSEGIVVDLRPAPSNGSQTPEPAPAVVVAASPADAAGIRLTLAETEFAIVGNASNLTEAAELVRSTQPDLCLVDVNLRGGGIALAAIVRDSSPRTYVVMLSSVPRDDDLFDALRAGASGFLLKDADPARLPHALRGVLNGEAALSRSLAARLVEEFRERGNRKHVGIRDGRGVDLTSREWEVLNHMRQGLTTKQIGLRLGISQVTVRRHIGAILRKLQVETRAQALELLNERS